MILPNIKFSLKIVFIKRKFRKLIIKVILNEIRHELISGKKFRILI